MIVAENGEGFRLVTQPDHAALSGEILSLWIADGLPSNPARSEIVFAGREHDNGWREADAAPYLDARKDRPYDFRDLPAVHRADVWMRGTSRFADSHPFATLLIVEHGLRLNRPVSSTEPVAPEIQALLLVLEERKAALLESTGATPHDVRHGYRFIEISDLISLAVAAGWQSFRRAGISGTVDGGQVRLSPFPLAGSTSFRLPCRYIPSRRYRGDADLAVEVASARWDQLRVRIGPQEQTEG